MPITPGQLIDVAVDRGLLDRDAVARLRLQARRERLDLLDAVLTHARIPMALLYRALAEARGLSFVDASALTTYPPVVKRLPATVLRGRRMLPVAEEGDRLIVATADCDDHMGAEMIRRLSGRPVTLVLAEPEALQGAIERALHETGLPDGRGEGTAVSAAPADPVALFDRIFKEAYLRRASDIHVEPHAEGYRARLRVDGRLQIYLPALSPHEGSSLVSRIKVLAGLDIAEQRMAQDGGFSYRPFPGAESDIDLRVATVATRWGERVTIRLLGVDTRDLTLEQLGLSSRDLAAFQTAICRPHGLILLTGPTGSGKTTTLYAALREINRPELNILTVEDPIEYVVSGISQTQVGEKMSFAGALRSFLRHDPDVLLVGEIRDAETLDVAMKASLTGHLVFSTLHTHSACSAVTRLVDMDCERYLIASTLTAVIAQRLVRRLCARCRRPRPLTPEETGLLGDRAADREVFAPAGCAYCLGTGYRGRIALFEALWVHGELARLIHRGASEDELRTAAGDRLTTLWEDGWSKVRQGVTSLDEVLAVAIPEEH